MGTNASGGGSTPGFANFSDADFKQTIWSALRMVAIAVVVGLPLLGWKQGWPSAALFGWAADLGQRVVGVAAADDCADGEDGRGRRGTGAVRPSPPY